MRPNDAQLLCNRSAAAHGLSLFDAAHADAVAAAEVAPGRAQCHLRHGTAAAALRRWPEAAAAYERALAIKPGADDARQRLAMVQAAMLAEAPSSSPERLAAKAAACGVTARCEEAGDVATPPGVSPEPARASDSEDGGGADCAAASSIAETLRDAVAARGESGIRVAAPMAAPAAETDADAAALAAALAVAARCGDTLGAKAAALAARVAELEAELAALHGAQCVHCGRCALPSYF